ncbi:MAG TPA: hypothetical protein VIK99_08185 [Thermaerobacter sp.]
MRRTRLPAPERQDPHALTDRLLQDAPLIARWCEGVVEDAARHKASRDDLPQVRGERHYTRRDPVFEAVWRLEQDVRYQYARRFVRYLRLLPSDVQRLLALVYGWWGKPRPLVQAARRCGMSLGEARAWLEAVRREVAERFWAHPLQTDVGSRF